jgi:hypothetical protein
MAGALLALVLVVAFFAYLDSQARKCQERGGVYARVWNPTLAGSGYECLIGERKP